MASYKLSNDAKTDLKNIYRYGVEQHGLEQADDYFAALIQRFDQIVQNPFLYPSVEHIKEGYRRSICGQDAVYYRITDEHIEVMRIIGQQDL